MEVPTGRKHWVLCQDHHLPDNGAKGKSEARAGVKAMGKQTWVPISILGCLLQKGKVSWSGIMMPSISIRAVHSPRLSSNRKQKMVQKADRGKSETTSVKTRNTK